jgi:hypothetical protein
MASSMGNVDLLKHYYQYKSKFKDLMQLIEVAMVNIMPYIPSNVLEVRYKSIPRFLCKVQIDYKGIPQRCYDLFGGQFKILNTKPDTAEEKKIKDRLISSGFRIEAVKVRTGYTLYHLTKNGLNFEIKHIYDVLPNHLKYEIQRLLDYYKEPQKSGRLRSSRIVQVINTSKYDEWISLLLLEYMSDDRFSFVRDVLKMTLSVEDKLIRMRNILENPD